VLLRSDIPSGEYHHYIQIRQAERLTRGRNFDQTIITVKVGGKDYAESFSCHRELLRRCSPYFNTCLGEKSNSPYEKSGTTLDLDDTTPDVFDAFMLWLYTGFIPHHLIEGGKEVHPPTHAVSVNGGDSSSTTGQEEGDDVDTASWGIALETDDTEADATPANAAAASSPAPSAEKVPGDAEPEKAAVVPPPRNPAEKPEIPKETLCPCCSRPYKWRGLEGFLERRFISLYVFAHRYAIPKLRRAVILAWQTNDEILQVMPDHSNVIAAYESLPPDAPLCRYFLDMYSVYWNPDRDDERTFNIKDFGDSIPGHGGMTDRMDCQFIMGFFAFMYYQSFIAVYKASPGSVLETAITGLTPEEQVALVKLLAQHLVNQGQLAAPALGYLGEQFQALKR
jgi:hypothetical protein